MLPPGIRVGTAFEQQSNDVSETRRSGKVDRCAPRRGRVDISAPLDQKFCGFSVALLDCIVKCRCRSGTLINISTLSKELLNSREIAFFGGIVEG